MVQIVSAQRKWNLNNPDKIKEIQKRYIEKDRAKYLERRRGYYKRDLQKSRELARKYAKLYKLRHPEKLKERAKEYRIRNKDKIAINNKLYRIRNKEKIRLYLKGYLAKYNKKNKFIIQKKFNEYRNKRAKEDINYKLNMLLHSKVKKGLKRIKIGNNPNWKTELGYDAKILKEHLEKRFTNKMNWNNYGTYWEIDHRIPTSLFKNREQLIKVGWKLDNLRPLERGLNRSKNNRYFEVAKNKDVICL